MSQKDDELNEDELNSLLADLESRAGSESGGQKSSASAGGSDDDEDLEAFLSRLESEESSSSTSSSKVATKERDDELAAQFADLENMQPDDLPAKPEQTAPAKKKDKKKKDKKEKKKKKASKADSTEVAKKGDEADESADKTPSRGAAIAKIALKWAMFALPVVALTWVLGAFLANWVSAGWLIAIVALTFALGVPALARHFSKKGKFSWWAAGLGLLFTVGLTVPMPQTAGENMTRFGHWPASAVADVAGWETDNAFVQLNSGVAGLVGGLLYSGPQLEANELGTDHPLGGPEATEEAAASDPSE